MGIRAITSVGVNFPSILHKKSYFFYFTHSFLQNTHISLSILHIYSIKYSLFFYFLLFSPSPKPISLRTTLSLSHRLEPPPHKPSNFSFDEAPVHHAIHHVVHRLVALVGPKFDPPLLRLRRLIRASSSSRQSRRRWRRRHVLRPNPTKILESWRRQSESA